MAAVTFSVSISSTFSSKFLQIPVQTHEFDLRFEEGSHTYTSNVFELGTIKHLAGLPVKATLQFKYTFDTSKSLLRICDTDYPSYDGMTLFTSPGDLDETCIEHAAPIGAIADEGATNRFWNHNAQLITGARDVLKTFVREASDALIKAVSQQTTYQVLIRKLLPKLSQEDYLSICPVYRNGLFLEHYDSSKQYNPDDVIGIAESVSDGFIPMPNNTIFANVIGSTPDPKPAGYTAWTAVWTAVTNLSLAGCTSLNYPPPPYGSTYTGCSPPTASLHGGHILIGTTQAATRQPGATDVYLVPICAAHNNTAYTGPMRAQAAAGTQAVHLLDYLEDAAFFSMMKSASS